MPLIYLNMIINLNFQDKKKQTFAESLTNLNAIGLLVHTHLYMITRYLALHQFLKNGMTKNILTKTF